MKSRVTFEADYDLRCAITCYYTGETDTPASRADVMRFFYMFGTSTTDDVLAEWQSAVEGKETPAKTRTRKEMREQGYSPAAIAIEFGGPVGSDEYYKILKEEGADTSGECPHCGSLCFGTGDCNCLEE